MTGPSATAAPAVPADGWRRTPAADGTPIAWRLDPAAAPATSEPTTVVLSNGIGCTDSQWWGVLPELSRTHPVVRWHYRGHGFSGRPARPARVDVPTLAADLRTVLQACGASRVLLVGHSFGVQVSLEALRGAVEPVCGVVAVAGAAGQPLSRRLPRSGSGSADGPGAWTGTALLQVVSRLHTAAPRSTARLWHRLWRSPLTPVVGRALGGTSALTPPEALAAYAAHVQDLDVGMLTRMFRHMQDHSAFDLLDHLAVPLLCVAGDADGFTPLAVMAGMARRAPRGALQVVPRAAHTLPVERPEALVAALRGMLRAIDVQPRPGGTSPPRAAAADGAARQAGAA